MIFKYIHSTLLAEWTLAGSPGSARRPQPRRAHLLLRNADLIALTTGTTATACSRLPSTVGVDHHVHEVLLHKSFPKVEKTFVCVKVIRMADGGQAVVGGARVVSGAEKKII